MFSLQLKAFEKKAVNQLEDARRAILLRLFRDVIYDTPVLTGRLRGEWQLSIGSPSGTPTGIASRNSGSMAMRQVESVLNSSSFGDTVYLVNLMAYAYPIEFYGHSSVKAPQGMVRKNVMRLTRIAQAVARSYS